MVVHKVYWESSIYKEYTVIEEDGLLAIHLPSIERGCNSLEKYSSRCIDLMTPILTGKRNLVFHLNNNRHVKFGIQARSRFGLRLIYTLHFLPNYFSYLASGVQMPENLRTKGDEYEKLMVSEADHVICVTRFAKEMMNLHYGLPEEKMTVIYNGCSQSQVNNPHNDNTQESVKKQFGFSSNESLILFVGRLSWGKGVNKLIEAFNLLVHDYDNLRLVLVGKGEFEPFMEQVQGNFGWVSFTGKLPAEQVKQLYQIAEIGVIPSEFEQCSYVALEMMQHGLPIVCSDAPGLKELFAEGKSALFAPLKARTDGLLGLEISVQELYRAIKQLLDNESLARKLSQIAHTNWQNHYTTTRMGQATINVYRQLLNMKTFDNSKVCQFNHLTI